MKRTTASTEKLLSEILLVSCPDTDITLSSTSDLNKILGQAEVFFHVVKFPDIFLEWV